MPFKMLSELNGTSFTCFLLLVFEGALVEGAEAAAEAAAAAEDEGGGAGGNGL